MNDALSGFNIKRVSTADQVATLLRERILCGDFKPGTPLREAALASLIGVSRNSLREALRILIQEGLVRHTVHRGISVTQLDPDDIGEIYRLRRLLEGLAVESAQPDEEELAGLADAADQLEQAAQAHDWPKLVELDIRFHRLLVGLLGSERLDAFYSNLVSELRLGLVMLDRASPDFIQMSSEHRKFVKLLAAGRHKDCARALDAHLAETERRVREIVTPSVPAVRAPGAERTGRR
jgi:DNA-binding GntR family transcriptional regulator